MAKYTYTTLGGLIVVVLVIVSPFVPVDSFKPSEDGGEGIGARLPTPRSRDIVDQGDEEAASEVVASSYINVVSGAEIASRVGYELVIARFAMTRPGIGEELAFRMNVDQSRAAELGAEFQRFIDARDKHQSQVALDTCNRRDSIGSVDELVDELRGWSSRSDEWVDQELVVLLSRLTRQEAERLAYLADEFRMNTTGADVDPEDFFRARGEVDLENELSRICAIAARASR